MSRSRKRQKLSPDYAEYTAALANDTIAVEDTIDLDREPSNVKQQATPNTLFVRALPPDATSETLTEHFSQSYLLKHAVVVIDPTTQQSKGYGFVTFADPEDAEKAREEFNGSLLGKRKLRVELAQPRRRVVEDVGVSGARKSRPGAEALEAKSERLRKHAEHRNETKLIIRNLPWSIKEPAQLSNLFKGYGKIKKTIIPPAKPGRSPGFGFIVLQTKELAEKALKALNGTTIEGRTLAVDWTVDKETWERHKTDVEDAHIEQDAGSGSDDENGGVGLNDRDSQDRMETDQSDVDEDSGLLQSDDGEENDIEPEEKPKQENGTLFVRNLPFITTDDDLFGHFSQFGALRYARVVMDQETERSRGTGFVCFYDKEDAILCLRIAPKKSSDSETGKESRTVAKQSLLQDTMADPEGRFTLDGRVLHVSRAVEREEAHRLLAEGQKYRDKQETDKRRLYLLAEGTITPNSPLYDSLAPSERKLRDDSTKQRRALVRGNPSLHISLTRLAIRNIPRFVTSKQLKALARQAVVQFATEVKAGSRQPLSKEELARDAEAMKAAEKARKAKGQGIVRQAKVVFEDKSGGKVSERSEAGRSRGYGFIEYNTHRLALMGLRYLNGHLVQRSTDSATGPSEANAEKPKRLVVEFAIENVQVVTRRREREEKSRNKGQDALHSQNVKYAQSKRKRGAEAVVNQPSEPKSGSQTNGSVDKSAIRNRMISRKKAARRRTRKAA